MAEIVTLYHGSRGGLVGDIAPMSRMACDFGRGFYLGDAPSQPLTLVCDGENPHLYRCEFDLEGLVVHRFEPTVDWALFVAWNRKAIPSEFMPHYDAKFRPLAENADVIYGKIANDRMFVVLTWFFEEFISDVGLLQALQALNLGNQYCARNENACRHVRVVEDRVLSSGECARLRQQADEQRQYAVKMVDRIRREHRRDGLSFYEIMKQEVGG